MERLFSPWRSKYIESFFHEKNECILCKAYQESDDDKHLIVTRGEKSYVIMNLFPYNSGHVMVVPYRHLPDITELDDEETLEIMSLVKKMMLALRAVSQPDGFNIGSNIGRTGGAGLDQHVHFHIVPRWNGDTNFMPTVADTKLISEDLKETMLKLRKTLSTEST